MSSAAETPEREAMAAFVLRLRSAGIRDTAVLRAIETLPRPLFVLPGLEAHAFDNLALPIQCGQTITPPDMVAVIAQALAVRPTDRVLEIGTGSGYLTAVLARLSRRVFTIDRWRGLITEAEARLRSAEITNVTMMVADGLEGWPKEAPFDRIVMTASVSEIPPPLFSQLSSDGLMVLPLLDGAGHAQLCKVDAHGVREGIAHVRVPAARQGVAKVL